MTDQHVTSLEHEDVAPQEPAAKIEPRTQVMLVAAFCTVVLAALISLLPVRYAILDPGPVLNTLGQADGKPLIAISGHATYPTTGTLDLTTVSVLGGPDRKLFLAQVVWAWLDHTTAVVPQEEIFSPGQTQQQSNAQNQAEMVSSQESATAAALSTLGIAVPTTLTVDGVQAKAPAAAVLKNGDVIRTINGEPITDLTRLRTTLQSIKPGARIDLQVRRNGEVVNLVTSTVSAAQAGRTMLGVFIDPTFSFPFSVKIQIEDIGGPSAGMMFALGIIDTLTPGDLTGGAHIAGTGTIDADGAVGPIGGIRQKMVGAKRAGARYFLAPAGDCQEVRGHVPGGLQVIRVSTLNNARDAVTAIAANRAASLPGC